MRQPKWFSQFPKRLKMIVHPVTLFDCVSFTHCYCICFSLFVLLMSVLFALAMVLRSIHRILEVPMSLSRYRMYPMTRTPLQKLAHQQWLPLLKVDDDCNIFCFQVFKLRAQSESIEEEASKFDTPYTCQSSQDHQNKKPQTDLQTIFYAKEEEAVKEAKAQASREL